MAGWWRQRLEHAVARGYGLGYEAIVGTFPPFQTLLNDVASYAARSIADGCAPARSRVLDIAAGVGTVAFRLAREGYTIIALDAIPHLVDVANARGRARGLANVDFRCLDVGVDPVPWPGTFDFAVSLHTLYWHRDPARVLESMREALRPGGCALVLNYSRPTAVRPTFCAIRARDGLSAAVGALRWLLPTAVFEWARDYEPHFTDVEEFHRLLTRAGFDILEARRTFLADVSVLAWVRRT